MPRTYQGVRFTRALPRVTAAAVRKAEEVLGVALPDDYRAFLRTVNGGIPTPGEFEMAEPERPGERICIDFFYGLRASRRENDLLYEQEELSDRVDCLPKGFVTIGFDPGSAPYFISTTGKRASAIYFFDPDGFLDSGRKPRLFVAADSFTDLLARLAAGE
jgi:hypothetical protein